MLTNYKRLLFECFDDRSLWPQFKFSLCNFQSSKSSLKLAGHFWRLWSFWFVKIKILSLQNVLRLNLNSKLFLTWIHSWFDYPWIQPIKMVKNGSTSKWLLTPYKLLKSLFFTRNLKIIFDLQKNCWSMASCLQERI